MTKSLFYFCTCTLLFLFPGYTALAQSLNVEVLAEISYNGERHSGSWVYARSVDEEYAVVGAFTGTVVYDMETFEELAFIPGPGSNWRELTVVGDHAYVVTEGKNPVGVGMQVLYLGDLPDTAYLLSTFTTTFQTGHIIQRDVYSESQYVYVMGTNTSRGIHVMDISDPAVPKEVSVYDPGHYIHDAHVKGDRIFASAFYEGTVDILDISDKSNPTVITRHEDTDGSIHSAWVTEDDDFLFVASERNGLLGKIWDIRDLNDIKLASTYTANKESLVHNPYIRGHFAHIAHNSEGYRVLDIEDPYLPVEVAYYDTYQAPSGGGGLWSVCPYSLSGKVIGGDRQKGLFIWETTEISAGRKYLFLRDAKTLDPVFDAAVVTNMDTLHSNVFGEVRIGHLPGTYTTTIQATGYDEKMIQLELNTGQSDTLFVDLDKISTSTSIDGESNQISIHPNPSNGLLHLNCLEGEFRFSVYTAQGQLIQNGKSINTTIIFIAEPGLYTVIVKSASGDYSKKVLIK